MKTADLERISASGQETPATVDANPTAQPVTGTVEQGQVAPASTASDTAMASTSDASTRTRLPKTASSMPLVALSGLITLFAGFGLALWRRSGMALGSR